MISAIEGGAEGGVQRPPYFMLGMRIDTLDPVDAMDRVITRAASGRGGYCCVSNVHQCVLTHEDPNFRAVVNGADMVVTDSRVLHRFVAKKYELPDSETMFGATMMLELCRRAESAGVPIGLIGGRDDVVLDALVAKLTTDYPRLKIAYRFSPPFRALSDAEEDEMLMKLRASGAQLAFVGLGCPKQERWMATYTSKIDAMLIGVGAAFDFNSGAVRRSPGWVHAAGLEWAYRLLAEPKRLWRRYLIESPRFLLAYRRETRRSAER